MLARCARVAPAVGRRCGAFAARLTTSVCLSWLTDTPAASASDSEPFAPLTVTVLPDTVAETPCGRSTGFFATRDMSRLPRCSRHDAEDFAALAGGPGLAIGHHAARGGNDGNTQPAEHLRQLGRAAIGAQSRPADPLDALD